MTLICITWTFSLFCFEIVVVFADGYLVLLLYFVQLRLFFFSILQFFSICEVVILFHGQVQLIHCTLSK